MNMIFENYQNINTFIYNYILFIVLLKYIFNI